VDQTALPTPPWRRTVRRAEPPRRQVSQDLIVDATLRLVREEGLDAVSIRRIAETLKIGPATIYLHFANKGELLEFALDQVMGEVVVPTPDPEKWAEQLREVARSAYRALMRHGDISRASLGDMPTLPNALRVGEGMLAIMVAGGVPVQLAAWAKDRILLYVNADAYEGSQFVAKERKYGREGVRTFLDQVRAYYASLPPEEFSHSAKNAAALVAGSCDDRFEIGLDLLVEGLIVRAAQD
jgi:AcrR family transcriptional regulator